MIEEIATAFPALIELYDNTASLQDRTVATGVVQPGLRAAVRRRRLCRARIGRTFDARRSAALSRLMTMLEFDVPVLDGRRRQCPRLDTNSRGGAKPRV